MKGKGIFDWIPEGETFSDMVKRESRFRPKYQNSFPMLPENTRYLPESRDPSIASIPEALEKHGVQGKYIVMDIPQKMNLEKRNIYMSEHRHDEVPGCSDDPVKCAEMRRFPGHELWCSPCSKVSECRKTCPCPKEDDIQRVLERQPNTWQMKAVPLTKLDWAPTKKKSETPVWDATLDPDEWGI